MTYNTIRLVRLELFRVVFFPLKLRRTKAKKKKKVSLNWYRNNTSNNALNIYYFTFFFFFLHSTRVFNIAFITIHLYFRSDGNRNNT
jgi:hypothetical protein